MRPRQARSLRPEVPPRRVVTRWGEGRVVAAEDGISSVARADVRRNHARQHATPVPDFAPLLSALATLVRNTCRTANAGPDAATFTILTTPNAHQRRALDLLHRIEL